MIIKASKPDPHRTAGAESSRRVLRMLTYFQASRPLASIDTLAQAIGVPKSTAYRYVSLLREFGFLVEVEGGQYSLGPRVLAMAQAAQAAVNYVEIARPTMERLVQQTGETAFLLRRVGDHAICIGRCDPANPVRIFLEIGTAIPLHIGASPKLLLANLSVRERDSYLARAAKRDAKLETGLERLREELEHIRGRGVAITIDEITPGVWACGAPVQQSGKLAAALSIAGPAFRIDRAARITYEALVREAAGEVSAKLQSVYEAPGLVPIPT